MKLDDILEFCQGYPNAVLEYSDVVPEAAEFASVTALNHNVVPSAFRVLASPRPCMLVPAKPIATNSLAPLSHLLRIKIVQDKTHIRRRMGSNRIRRVIGNQSQSWCLEQGREEKRLCFLYIDKHRLS